jgi:predicted transcriptional regulator
MENLLVHFALAKTLYSEKKNYLETFAPFVLDILASQDKVLSINEVSDILSNSYQLTIPFHTIQSIIRHLNNKQFIDITDKNKANIRFVISEKGKQECSDFQTNEDDVSRKLNKLFIEFNKFVNTKYQVKYELSYVQTEIIGFIKKNLPKLAIFAMNDIEDENGYLSEFDLHCIDFIGEIEQHEPELFTTFNELLRGSILWNEIRKENLMSSLRFYATKFKVETILFSKSAGL